MKKIILSILILVSALLLFACKPQNSESGNNNQNLPKYTVTFDSAGGSAVSSQYITEGEPCTMPNPPTRAGAKFVGWFLGENQWFFKINVVEKDITLTARWELESFNITYDLSGGYYDGELQKSYNIETGKIALGAPKRENCTFLGWLFNGEYITEIDTSGLLGAITVKADFAGPDATADSTTATVRTWDNTNNITVRLTDVGPSQANLPLNIKIDFTKEWDTVKVAQGGKVTYIKTTLNEDGERILEMKMIANSDDAVITPVIRVGKETVTSSYGEKLANGIVVDKNYFPGFTRKAVTFSIDDGNVEMDKKLLSILRPAGIIGTFNLINTSSLTDEEYLELYKGYEIANHHGLHALPMLDGFDFDGIEKKDEIFSSSTADVKYVYKTDIEGLYYIDYKQIDENSTSPYWHPIATDETYKKYAELTKKELEEIFGEKSVSGFVYPHGKLSEAIKKYLKEAGYLYARKTGVISDSTKFNLPNDRYEWSYNANHENLNIIMEKYAKLKDDGNLKMFSFGVHAIDYDGKWTILETFAEKYGNRPEDFYYATCSDIFRYQDAVEALQINEAGIVNNSDIDLFVTVNGKKIIVYANSTYSFAELSASNIKANGSDTAVAVITENTESSITVRLSDTAPVNGKLTVSLTISQEWASVQVAQGEDISFAESYMDGEVRKIDISILPNSEHDAVITLKALESAQ